MKKRKVQEEADKEDKKRRVLAKISSRHSTRDLPCKVPE